MEHRLLKSSTVLFGLLLTSGCASSPGTPTNRPATGPIHSNAVFYDGPDLVATVAYMRGKNIVAEEWLILAAEFTSKRGRGPMVINRDDIAVLTPAGGRLGLISQDEFWSNTPRFQIPVERTLNYLPLLYRFEQNRVPCGRWYLVDPSLAIAYDEITVSSFEQCSGPLIFEVPGGVQPGRWRLVIELEESRADIPFVIEVEN